jgi:hypothetical protein
MRMGFLLISLALIVLVAYFSPVEAYRDYLTVEQKAQLEKIQTVLVEALALTDKGPVDAAPIVDVASRRLAELGYTVVRDAAKPHDATFKLKCEQRKIWEGTTAAGGDADLPDAPSRLWKGPACQLGYLLGETKIKWQKEVRTDFEDAVAAAMSANAGDPGAYAMAKLREKLDQYDFPILLAAEWGHPDRLLKLLDAAGTPQGPKIKIMSIKREMQPNEEQTTIKD